MSAEPPPVDVRGVRRELTAARDEQIAKVVAMVDGLTNRDNADDLIAPLRPRLATLALGRPLGLTRLLFMPVDPLIVAPKAWRKDAEGIPRSALAPLAAIVRPAIGPVADRIDAELVRMAELAPTRLVAARHAGLIAPELTRLGEALWAEGARIIAAAAPPTNWRETSGLLIEDFIPIARSIAAVLVNAAAQQKLAAATRRDGEADADALAGVIAAALNAPPSIAAAATSVLLVSQPRPDQVLATADALSAGVGAAHAQTTERAIDFALDRMEASANARQDPATRQQELHNSACLLQALDTRPGQTRARRARLAEVRRTLDTACRGHFKEAMSSRLLGPMAELRGTATDAQVETLEKTARELRRLESTGRQIGGSSFYGGMLRSTAATVAETPGLTLADRVRLTEMLADSDTAMALFHKG